MSPRRPPQPTSKPPDFPPEKTYRALNRQLDDLESFRGKTYHEVNSQEREWSNLTKNIIIHGFGDNSQNVSQFQSASWVGTHRIGGMSPAVLQSNFQKRIEAFAAVLRSCMSELKLMMPDSGITGAYDTGEEYEFYRDLKTIIAFATGDVLIVDAYLDVQLFDVYVENLNPATKVRVLTSSVGTTLKMVAEKFSKRGNFELRSSNNVHDRVIFADSRCWVIGQSIKDAARKKPTYIVEHTGGTTMKDIYEVLWSSAVTVV